jgi:hypothetical protein
MIVVSDKKHLPPNEEGQQYGGTREGGQQRRGHAKVKKAGAGDADACHMSVIRFASV